MIRFFILVLLYASFSHGAATQKTSPANNLNNLVNAIQNYYNKTSAATFDFSQNYKSVIVPTNEISKGKVFFKAGHMLWRYLEPANSQKEFYIADKKFTYYRVNDKIAYTHNCFDQDTLSASITFLWRKGRLRESFIIKAYTGTVDPKSNLKWLTLIPKETNAPVKSISLGADAKTGLVKESIVTDSSNGVSHYVFTNFNAKPKFAANTFDFVAKPGVRVQPMPNVVCPDKTQIPKAPVKKKN